MSANSSNPTELKMLPGMAGAASGIVPASQPARQLSELPKDELEHLAEEFGLDARDFKTRQHLVTALHERRRTINFFRRKLPASTIPSSPPRRRKRARSRKRSKNPACSVVSRAESKSRPTRT